MSIDVTCLIKKVLLVAFLVSFQVVFAASRFVRPSNEKMLPPLPMMQEESDDYGKMLPSLPIADNEKMLPSLPSQDSFSGSEVGETLSPTSSHTSSSDSETPEGLLPAQPTLQNIDNVDSRTFRRELVGRIWYKVADPIERELAILSTKPPAYIRAVLNDVSQVHEKTPLVAAVCRPSLASVRMLLGNKFPTIFQAMNVNIFAPVMTALERHYTGSARRLYGDLGQKIYEEIIILLLRHPSFDPDVQDGRGMTVLHVACEHLDKQLMDIMIEKKSDASIKDNQGRIPWTILTNTDPRRFGNKPGLLQRLFKDIAPKDAFLSQYREKLKIF